MYNTLDDQNMADNILAAKNMADFLKIRHKFAAIFLQRQALYYIECNFNVHFVIAIY